MQLARQLVYVATDKCKKLSDLVEIEKKNEFNSGMEDANEIQETTWLLYRHIIMPISTSMKVSIVINIQLVENTHIINTDDSKYLSMAVMMGGMYMLQAPRSVECTKRNH